jgi:hypothetical protein
VSGKRRPKPAFCNLFVPALHSDLRPLAEIALEKTVFGWGHVVNPKNYERYMKIN